MLAEELVEWFVNYYKDANEENIEAIRGWVRNNVAHENLEEFRDALIEEYPYKTIPTVAKIREIWELKRPGMSIFGFTAPWLRVAMVTSEWSIPRIFQRFVDLRSKAWNGEGLNWSQEVFVTMYEDLYYNYQILLENGWEESDVIKHLEEMKIDQLCRDGERFWVDPDELIGPKTKRMLDKDPIPEPE